MTYSQLESDVLLHAYPAGIPDNLLVPYKRFVVEALIYLQKAVKCLQEKNTDIYPFCGTYIACNCTVVPAPQGRVSKVFTTLESDYCTPVALNAATYNQVLCEAEKVKVTEMPPATYGLPYPFVYATAVADRTVCGRSNYGFYAIHNDRIYVAPFLDSSEQLVVEWTGLKRSYSASDVVSDDPEVFRAVKLYVQKEASLHYEHDTPMFELSTLEFRECVADLWYECQMQTRVREAEACENTCADICGTAGVVTSESTSTDGGTASVSTGDDGGVGSVLAGDGPPSSDPGVDAAVYWDRTNKVLYNWNDALGEWE